MILDGKKVSEKILNELAMKVAKMDKKPHLAVIIVGDDPASQLYVKNKQVAAKKVGINSTTVKLPETVSEIELLNKIKELNENDDISGILVQLPLPNHINKNNVVMEISPRKDVDGFTIENVGRLSAGLEPYFYPATPQGIIMLLKEYNIPLEGAEVVVIGRSNIVGKPMIQLLLKNNATVVSCNSYTKNLDEKIKTADIVISAVGKKIVRCKMIKKSAVLIDVGIYKDTNGQLTGDIDFDFMVNEVEYITPVPGGVGPMTIASLMYNASIVY